MTNDNRDQLARRDRAKLAFLLAQLRDEIDDIVRGLERGSLTYGTARAAVAKQLKYLLAQLKIASKNGE